MAQAAKKRILVVDDNLQSRKLMKGILEFDGYEVVTVEGGEEAIEFLSMDKDIDLIITDMFMPFMLGVELVEHLKGDQNTKEIPLLGISAHLDKKGEVEVDDFINKPIVRELLLEKVKKLVRS
jgi:CheY-like chemotaxis protein